MEIETDQSIEAMDTQDTQEVEILTSDLQQQPQQQQTPQQQQNSPPQLPKFKNLIQPQLHAVGAVTQLPSENGNVPPQQLLAGNPRKGAQSPGHAPLGQIRGSTPEQKGNS